MSASVAREGGSPGGSRTSKLAVGLGLGASAAVGATAALGRLTAVEVIVAFVAAGGIAAVSVHNSRPLVVPHTLTAPVATSGEALIAAPRARNLLEHPSYPSTPARPSAADAA